MTNCPKDYKNLGCESFADQRKLTLEMFRQFCKNDAYLYDQINKLWDATDPESRKRFYPPFFMDAKNSFGVEPCKKDEFSILAGEDVEEELYHLANSRREEYNFDFDKSNDEEYRSGDTLYISNDSLIEDDSTLQLIASHDSSTDTISYELLPYSVTETIKAKVPYTVGKKKTIKTKEDVYAKKSKLDAYCDGAYHDWKCNSVWYIGYNRHKNYNIKNKWRKNPDDTSIPSVCRAQTFKAKQTGLLTKVGFMMRGSKSSASPLIVEIRTTKKGKPTSKVLASTKQKFNHSTNSMVNFTFEKACKIEAGKRYAIVLRSPLSQFNHCYWIGGWASSCFSNSRKRAYYDGETFLSEDNGKTWIVHGKKEKCYGSHYYDWGFAEPPVNFGFEVYVSPKTGTQTVKTITDTTTNKTWSPSITFDYYPKGDYYLNFKGFYGNRYETIDFEGNFEEATSSKIGTWTWEVYCPTKRRWYPISTYGDTDKCGGVSAERSTGLTFSTPKPFVKARLKLTLSDNILADPELSESQYKTLIQKAKNLHISDSTKLTNWKNSISSKFSFNKTIRQVEDLSIILTKSPAPYGYLHTLNYHPEQDTMLPACIWSEVNAKALIKDNENSKLKIDIVHEEDKIERFILTYTDNYDLLNPYLEEFLGEADYTESSVYEYKNGTFAQQCTAMKNYIVDNDGQLTEKGVEFYEYLQKQSPKVYFLPQGNVSYFEGYNDDCITLEDYPSYAINSMTMTSQEDTEIDFMDLTVQNSVVKYTVPRSISIDQITLRCAQLNEDGDLEYEEIPLVNQADNSEAYDFSVNDNVITFVFTGKYKDSSNNDLEDCVLSKFATHTTDTLTLRADNLDGNGICPSMSCIVLETTDSNLNEFEHYLVDYDNRMIKFLDTSMLVEGDIKVNYNPVWARNLDIDDFPLKLDLWVEHFVAKTEADGLYFGKLYYDGNDAKVKWFSNPKTIVTLTSPRDNLREVVKNEENDNIQYEEDNHFEVDYLTNTIEFEVGKFDATRQLNETVVNVNGVVTTIGDIITVKYTPNLTDNGLAMVYKMYRTSFANGIDGLDPNTVDTFGLLYDTQYSTNMNHDVFIGSNYWTYRT